jgi:TolB-like protein/class 3 adenylate cyclase/Tfp pilus assembly protein PilF
MADEGFKRKLAAILSADVEGYSRLMDDDEEATVRTLTTYRTAINDLVQQYRGRIVDAPGDNILAEFTSVVDAVNCAVEIQRELAERNAELHSNRKMEFRIGVNLGDVIEEEGRIYGDGVNIAARVEAMAEAGGICISGRAYDQVANKLGLEYENLGEHQVKNISTPIRVYRVSSFPGAAAHRVVQAKEAVTKRWRNLAITAGVAVVIVALAPMVWQYYQRESNKVEAATIQNMAYPLPDKPSFAVLPFSNMSDDPDIEYLGDGFADTLIGALSRLPGIFVIARTSTFSYKGKPVTVKQVAEELGVQYVVEGSVQKSEDQLRVTIQMIDALTGYHLWSERFARKIKDIFKIQDEITLNIVKLIGTKHESYSEYKNLASQVAGTNNLEAYLKILKATELFWKKISRENLEKARLLCQDSIALDPNYIFAYCFLTQIHSFEARRGYSKSPEKSRQLGLNMAKKAVELDESSSIAHSVLGYIYYNTKQHGKSLEEYKKAIALDPNNPEAYAIGYLYCYMGKPQEAIPYFNKVIRISPKARLNDFNLGLANLCMGKYEDAIPYYQKAIKRVPGYWRLHVDLAGCYAALGMEEEAKAEVQHILTAAPNFTLERYVKGLPAKRPEDIKPYIDALHKIPMPE